MGKEVVRFGFSVQGEFITRLAREKFYNEGRLDYAVELLISCMETDQISKTEIKGMAYAILNGEAEIHGTYPGDDYGFRYLDKKDDRYNMESAFSKLVNKNNNLEKRCSEMEQKLIFLSEQFTYHTKKELNKEYKDIFNDEILFPDVLYEPVNNMLNSFLKRFHSDEEDDYGWLEPNGNFHPVEWGAHQEFAYNWLEENLSENDAAYEEIIEDYDLYKAGDYLMKRGWVLLHNPGLGVAFPTADTLHRYTKAQKDFLYDYYIKRNCHKEANAFFEEDDF